MTDSEICTSPDNVLAFPPVENFKTQHDLLRFVERTRRQLDRMGRLPGADGKTIDPTIAARVRLICDELETDVLNGLSSH